MGTNESNNYKITLKLEQSSTMDGDHSALDDLLETVFFIGPPQGSST